MDKKRFYRINLSSTASLFSKVIKMVVKTKGFGGVDIISGLDRVTSSIFQMLHVVLVNAASDVVAVEHRCIKHLDVRTELLHRVYQFLEAKVYHTISTDFLCHLFIGASVGDQFVTGRHVDTVYVGVSDRWGARSKVDLFGSSFTSHLNDFLRSCTSYNRVYYQELIVSVPFPLI